MEKIDYNFKAGEIVALPYEHTFISKGGQMQYEHFAGSRYVCIREDSNDQYGILVKFLGNYVSPFFMVKGGEPFCKDDKFQGFESSTYYSYRFPLAGEVKEVLDILKKNEDLVGVFGKLSMEVDLNSTFWVRDIEKRFPFRKHFRFYDPKSDDVFTSTDKQKAHCRIAIAYFHNSELIK